MRLLVFGLLLAGVALAAQAQQYRWEDEQGHVHYTDTPPPASAKSVRKHTFKGNSIGSQPNTQLQQALKQAPVKLYTHPECTQACRVAREVLNRRGIPFEEVSATTPENIAQLKAVSGGLEVPVLVVGSQVERIASEQTYEAALDRGGYPPRGVVPPRER